MTLNLNRSKSNRRERIRFLNFGNAIYLFSYRSSLLIPVSNAKQGTLICTDVAARGLDIPSVDWIIQLDPPDGLFLISALSNLY